MSDVVIRCYATTPFAFGFVQDYSLVFGNEVDDYLLNARNDTPSLATHLQSASSQIEFNYI